MGVLNATPDSFSDGGRWMDRAAAVEHALAMAREGADVVDVGGESTRPGAAAVALDEELERVVPLVAELARRAPDLALSVDTQKAEVARRALEAGACMVNDVSALRADPGMAAVAASAGAGVCLMHRAEAPALARWSREETRGYPAGVAEEVAAFLEGRVVACVRAGIPRERLWVDPGFGFGKSVADNLRLLKDLPRLRQLGLPVLAGPSRKSFLGSALGGLDVGERLPATLAACALAVWQGASVLRVHDVRPAAQAVRLAALVRAS